MCNPHNNIRKGASLADKKAHAKDHKRWSRRNFIRGLGLTAGTGMMLAKTPISAIASSPLAYLLNEAANEDRVFVLIRLKGGNDGLNTIVPLYDYSTYQSYRPNIALAENSLLGLSNEFGMHPNLQNIKSLWDDGKMKVVNNVGYDNHSLSHFRSTDIWGSASDASEVINSGWLGRFLENEYPDYLMTPPPNPPAIQIGSSGSLLFNGAGESNTNYSLAVTSPDELFEIAQTGQLYDTQNIPDCHYGTQLEYLRTVANTTFIYADIIKQAYDNSSTEIDFTTSLGNQLALVSRLIKGGLGTKFYVVSLDGFDTHAGQLNSHAQLMNNLSSAVREFYEDLGAKGKDVLSMTFSEFGRRVQQNASQGTDHGTAAPIMLFGEGLNGNGFIGTGPDLDDLDNNGNLKFGTDFREIYASVLENWLCIDPDLVNNILGQSFDRLDIGLTCSPQVSSPSLAGYQLQHEARYTSDGQIIIRYTLPNTMFTKVEVFNILGQSVAKLHQGRQSRGEHQLTFRGGSQFAPSSYVYRIEANGQAYSNKIVLMR